MKVHHVAHYEYGSRPHSEMREKEFPTRWEAEKFCEEWRREHWYFGGAAWAESITEPRPITANDVLAAAVIKKILRYQQYDEENFNFERVLETNQRDKRLSQRRP